MSLAAYWAYAGVFKRMANNRNKADKNISSIRNLSWEDSPMKRRNFLKAGLAGAVAGGATLAAPAVHAAEKFRWKQELFQNWLLIPPTIRTALYQVFL